MQTTKIIEVKNNGYAIKTLSPNGEIIEIVEFVVGQLFKWLTMKHGNTGKLVSFEIDNTTKHFLVHVHVRLFNIKWLQLDVVTIDITQVLNDLGYKVTLEDLRK